MRVAPIVCAGLLFGIPASAQVLVLDSTQIMLDPGTTMRILGNTDMVLGHAVQFQNNGTLDLGAAASISETPGSPMTGLGVERSMRPMGAVLNAVEPGGLGWTMTTAAVVDSLELVRGHASYQDTSGRVSVFRWYDVTVWPENGLDMDVVMRYDTTELNGLNEPDLMLHVATLGDTVWSGYPSMVNTSQRIVSVEGLDSLGRFSLFAGSIGTQLEEADILPSAQVSPIPTDGPVRIVTKMPGRGRVRILDLTGREMASFERIDWSGPIDLNIAHWPSGAYFILFGDGQWAKLIRS
ncbi:MAG: hypothetical protein KDB88_10140 [Flavobacteriales bacterium]|nr:hypothetical protein [Flavobacteriales bacterium]